MWIYWIPLVVLVMDVWGGQVIDGVKTSGTYALGAIVTLTLHMIKISSAILGVGSAMVLIGKFSNISILAKVSLVITVVISIRVYKKINKIINAK